MQQQMKHQIKGNFHQLICWRQDHRTRQLQKFGAWTKLESADVAFPTSNSSSAVSAGESVSGPIISQSAVLLCTHRIPNTETRLDSFYFRISVCSDWCPGDFKWPPTHLVFGNCVQKICFLPLHVTGKERGSARGGNHNRPAGPAAGGATTSKTQR